MPRVIRFSHTIIQNTSTGFIGYFQIDIFEPVIFYEQMLNLLMWSIQRRYFPFGFNWIKNKLKIVDKLTIWTTSNFFSLVEYL